MHAAEFERTEVNIPDAIVDFFQADILAGADDRHIVTQSQFQRMPPLALT
jgi:hypothetical protein